MYLYQLLFSDFISGIRLAINLLLWFFKYKRNVIIVVFDSTESSLIDVKLFAQSKACLFKLKITSALQSFDHFCQFLQY